MQLLMLFFAAIFSPALIASMDLPCEARLVRVNELGERLLVPGVQVRAQGASAETIPFTVIAFGQEIPQELLNVPVRYLALEDRPKRDEGVWMDPVYEGGDWIVKTYVVRASTDFHGTFARDNVPLREYHGEPLSNEEITKRMFDGRAPRRLVRGGHWKRPPGWIGQQRVFVDVQDTSIQYMGYVEPGHDLNGKILGVSWHENLIYIQTPELNVLSLPLSKTATYLITPVVPLPCWFSKPCKTHP